MKTVCRVFLMCVLLSTNFCTNSSSSPWYTQGVDKKITLNVDLFLSSTCDHCHEADVFFRAIEPQNPWLHVQRYIINEDKSALIRFNQLLIDQQTTDFSVPSIFFCNSRWAGFATVETTGKDLFHAFSYCKQDIEKKGALTDATVSVLKRWGNASLINAGMPKNFAPIHYMMLTVLFDVLNPCSFFGLAIFFALLFIQDKTKGRLIAGSLFTVIAGIMHYVQQVHTSIFFAWLPWLRGPAVLVGLFTVYLVSQSYRKRPTPYLLIGLVFVLALMTQVYQQTCLMNWSYMFEQWLLNQHVTPNQIGLYQLAYQIVYVLPLTVMLIVYVLISQTKRFTKIKEILDIMALLLITATALFLVLYPLALSNFILSLATIVPLVIFGWLWNTYK